MLSVDQEDLQRPGAFGPEPLPLGVRFHQAFDRAIVRTKEKVTGQAAEFGFESPMVRYRNDNQAAYQFEGGAIEMGVQADIIFSGSRFEGAFDRVFDRLLQYARKGTQNTGWPTSEDSPDYGNYQVVTLPNGRSYAVVNETSKAGQGKEMVSIRGDLAYPERGRREEGNYYFSRTPGVKEAKKIKICGAHHPNEVAGVMADIIQVASIVSKS
jgi:hypothetical protein